MNYYKIAIDENNVVDFFRGKGKFFDADLDREGTHNFSFTSYNIMGYGTEFGEKQLYERLNLDLLYYINVSDFGRKDLENIIGIIWVYNLFRKEDNLLKTDWIISGELRSLILSKVAQLEKTESDISNIKRIMENLSKRFDFNIGEN